MAIPKYKKHYEEMIEYNEEVFRALKELDRKSQEFKEIQRKAVRIVHQYENALCNRTESTKFSKFSTGLSDKFMEEVRRDYPEIDYT